nr:MAG TPA: hypothetical protein [Caudoviricetes sp.]
MNNRTFPQAVKNLQKSRKKLLTVGGWLATIIT